jgi:hypothetical protein
MKRASLPLQRREFIAGLLVAGTLHRALAQQAIKTYRLAVVTPSGPSVVAQ